MALQSITALSKITLQEASSLVTFSSIPSTYRDLVVVVNADNSVQTELFARFNGDSGNNYYTVRMQASGVSTGSASTSAASGARLNGNGDIMTDFSFNATITALDYSATDKHKLALSRTNSSNGVDACTFRWASTAPITSVTLFPNSGTFEVGSTFALFGRIA